MDLTTARLEVRERIGELTADFFTDSEVDRAINEATRHFALEERWAWLLTEGSDVLIQGDDTFELPDGVDVNRFQDLRIYTDDTVVPLAVERVRPFDGFKLRSVNHDRQAQPRYYYITSASIEAGGEVRYVIRFVPESDGDYTFDYLYFRVPEVASSGGETIDCPESYADAIPAWAAGKLFLKEHAVSQKASEQFAIYADIVEKARQEQQEANTDEVIALGREHPGEFRYFTEYDYIMGRIPPTGLGL